MAAVHLGLQVVTVATVCLAAVALARSLGGWRFALVASVAAAVLGAVACSLTMGLYLAAAIGAPPKVHAHANEAFAAAPRPATATSCACTSTVTARSRSTPSASTGR